MSWGRDVALVVDQDAVGALGSDAADEPLDVAVRPGRARWNLHDLDVVADRKSVV